MNVSNKFVSFGALLAISATGLAVIVIGACLLSWNAYLSEWMPVWTWVSLVSFTALGVGITATSVASAIATIAPNYSAAHKCLVMLLIFLGLEIAMSSYSALNQPKWSADLYLGLRKTMYGTLSSYSVNDTSKAMWDEIQLEMSCCGVENYEDWFNPYFENGKSVPDSCCLLPLDGCGRDIKNSIAIDDIIEVKGCLPTIAKGWKHTYQVLSKQALLPICVIQVIMILLIVLSYRSAGILYGHLPLAIRRPSIIKKSKEPEVSYSVMA